MSAETRAPLPDLEALRRLVRAVYLEGVQSGAEHASEVAAQHCREAGIQTFAARHRLTDEAGEFFDAHADAPDWPPMTALLDALREREEALRRFRDAADTVIDFAYRWSMEDGHNDMCILLDGADECNCGMDALREVARSLTPESPEARHE